MNSTLTFQDLLSASRMGDAAFVKKCLDADVDQNEHRGMPRGASPLMLASSNGHAGVVRLLLLNGATVDFCDGDGFTAVTLAGEHKHWEVVKLLAQHGASFVIPNATGRNGSDYLKPSYCRNKTVREEITDILATSKR